MASCLESIHHEDTAREFRSCGVFHMASCRSCEHDIRPVKISCHVRICPDCGPRAAGRLFERVLPTIEREWERRDRRRWKLRLITLTTRRPAEVTHAYIVDSYKQLLGGPGSEGLVRSVWRRRLKVEGAGVIAGCETGHGGMVHVHLLYWGPWIEAERLRSYWEARTGAYIVDVKLLVIDRVKTLRAAVREVVQYPITMHDNKRRPDGTRPLLAPQLAAWTLDAIHGQRRIRCYGVFYKLEDGEPDEPTNCCPLCRDTLLLVPGKAMSRPAVSLWYREPKNQYMAQLSGITEYPK